MVKGHQYSAYTVQATSMPAPQSQRWSLRPTLDLDNKFQSQETNSTAPYSIRVGCGMAQSVHAIYSTRLALFIHGITSAKRTREVWLPILTRESSTQLIVYSLDTCVKYSTYMYMHTNFQVSKRLHGGPEFLPITS